jgi:hypothetical protein
MFVLSSAAISGVGAVPLGEDIGYLSDSNVTQQSAGDDGANRAPTGVINVSESQTEIRGGAPNESVGWSVAPVGDVNGDGHDDLLVGAPSRGDENPGAAYLFYGPVTAANLSLADADVTILGESGGDRAGWSVDGGDVDGDGYADIVVGAPFNDEGGTDAGAVYVLYGGESMPDTVSLGVANAKLIGEANSSYAGFDVDVRSVSSPDVPGLLVGAPSSTEGQGPGTAYAVAAESLPESDSILPSSGEQTLSAIGAEFLGEANGDHAGWSVAWAGDIDADSAAEAMIGAPHRNRSDEERAGVAYLVEARASGSHGLSNASATFVGASANDNAGFSVAPASDMNGDGVADLIVGAPSNDSNGENAGAAYVFYGGGSLNETVSSSEANVTVHGERPGDRLGWSVGSAGDVDCDGYADVIVGAPYHGESGTSYVVYGRVSRGSFRAAKIVGRAAGDFAGTSVAGTSFADGDASDVIVGAPGSDTGGVDSGAVYLVRGGCEGDPATADSSTDARTADSGSGEFQSDDIATDDTGRDTRSVSQQGARDGEADRSEGGKAPGASESGETDTRDGQDAPGDGESDDDRGAEDPGDGSSGDDGDSGGEDGENAPDDGDSGEDDGDDGTERDEVTDRQHQRQSISVYQSQCQRQTDGEQHQSQEQGVRGGQSQSQDVGTVLLQSQYQDIDVVQNQCQYQGDGHNNVQRQRQVLRIVFRQNQSVDADGQSVSGDTQTQSQSFDSDQNQTQSQSESSQSQTQTQVFQVTFIQDQRKYEGENWSQTQSQRLNIDQNQDQRQGDGVNQSQTQQQNVRIIYQGQEQEQTDGGNQGQTQNQSVNETQNQSVNETQNQSVNASGNQSQTQGQSVSASQRQHQHQSGGAQNQTQNESIEVDQAQSQDQQDTDQNQTQDQSVSVDQSQNQSQGNETPNQTQNQSQSAELEQNQSESGGENQTQNQSQSAELEQNQTQNQTWTNSSESQNASVDVQQNQTQNQTDGNNTQTQDESISADQKQSQSQNDTNYALSLQQIENCGTTCREATGTLTNEGSETRQDVTVTTKVLADGELLWSSEESVGTLNPGESHTSTRRVNLTYEDGTKIMANDGYVTVVVVVHSKSGTVQFSERRKVS